MLINQTLGKLTPAHPDILPILEEIREKYQIPEISSTDNEMQILLRHELEFDWKAIHAEIQNKLKDLPDFIPEGTKKIYDEVKTYPEKKDVKDPDLEKVSEKFRDNFYVLMDMLYEILLPTIEALDNVIHIIADLCVEYLITGEAREIPEDWFVAINVINSFGEKTLVMQVNELADPDEAAELFKKKFRKTFGKQKRKLTEQHVKTADYLRMKWEGKPYLYILEEMELRDPEEYENLTNKRHPQTLRKKNDALRQRFHRMNKVLDETLL
ncbi:MAG: hypothetical protein HN736_09070 [Anaerolineae bacterium]|jgi:hypothetical protein|nr:hypothetical protein [Anaerolineae bacterium]MBT4459062.1 hypothetical protein [Anaerolineae bacterium]MBT6061221.1 hypothetical protein [Anaerolineae bacterium]MBT6811684.1 hypothetical protein [Anaerolineae bacterium]MBT7016677.1 hypothetical protein [Anaerolineae bacterium]